MDKVIEVYSDEKGLSQKPRLVLFRKDMSLNNFRRECSREFKTDIVSMFTVDSKRISDSSELEKTHKIIVSRNFYLKTDWNDIESITTKTPTVQDNYETFSDQLPLVARVEIIALPNTGKTTLIQKFLQQQYQIARVDSVIEAVYHQKLDISDSTVEFVLTDVIEESVPDIQERIFSRDVFLLAVSKQLILDQIASENFCLISEWIKSSWMKIRAVSPEAYVAILLCKYDLLSDNENVINEKIKTFLPGLRVFKLSCLEGMTVPDVYNPHQLFTAIGQDLIERRSTGSNSNKVQKESRKMKTTVFSSFQQNRRKPMDWSFFSCFRSFMG